MQFLAPRRSSIHFDKLNYVKQLTWKLTCNTSIIWITISQVSGKHTYSRYVKLFAKKLGSPARARTHTHTHTQTPLLSCQENVFLSLCCNDINQMKIFLFHSAFRIAFIWQNYKNCEIGNAKHPMWRADSLEKTLMLGGIGDRRRRGQQRMRWLDGIADSMHPEFGWTPGVGDGQGGPACYDSWGRKELDTTERLDWTELKHPTCDTAKTPASVTL